MKSLQVADDFIELANEEKGIAEANVYSSAR